MKVITIRASTQYSVLLEYGLLNNTGFFLEKIATSRKICIITDDIVDALYSNIVASSLETNGYQVFKFVFKNGESSKNLSTASSILDFLASNNFNRKDMLIALGGGVVGDIAGFAASVYMRGIKYVQIPTTLLAMVDASIGGKTAIDLQYGKNLAGTFYQPSLVICDLEIIKNLPNELYLEGLGEIVKYGLIKDIGLFSDRPLDINNLISKCIKIKKEYVEKDEYETKSIRQVLNIGHTFAHALEKCSKYTIPHGLAVATGIVYETAISNYKGFCGSKYLSMVKNKIVELGLFKQTSFSVDDMINAMLKDKKNSTENICFVLSCKISDWKLVTFSKDEIRELLNEVYK